MFPVGVFFIAPVRDHTRSRYETNDFVFFPGGYRQVGLYEQFNNKRPDLSGRPPCKGVAIGVARKGGHLSGERTLRVPSFCSLPVSHAGGTHVALFVVGRWCVRGTCARACWHGEACREKKRKECRPKKDRSPKQERSCVRAARLGYAIAVLFLRARSDSCDPSPVQRRQLRARARAQTAVLVPAAACGYGAAAMQLRERARARTAAAVPEAARGVASANSRQRRAEQAKTREQDTCLSACPRRCGGRERVVAVVGSEGA